MKTNVKKLVLMAILAAMSCVLYYFPKFPLPFFPSFLEINFSMLPILICGFILGWKEGIAVVFLRFLVKLLQTHTAGVGETADLFNGIVTVVVAAVSMNLLKDKKHAVLMSLGLASLAWIITGVVANYFYNIPQYINLYFGGNVEPLLGMLDVLPGEVNKGNYMWKYIIFAVIPFNMIISVVVSIVTYFVEKRIRVLFEEEQ